jgi:hypothetical protein
MRDNAMVLGVAIFLLKFCKSYREMLQTLPFHVAKVV